MLTKQDLIDQLICHIKFKDVYGQSLHCKLNINTSHVVNFIYKNSYIDYINYENDIDLCHSCSNNAILYINRFSIIPLCLNCYSEFVTFCVHSRNNLCKPLYNQLIYKILLFKNILIDDLYYYIGLFFIYGL